MQTQPRRRYVSTQRQESADATRARVLEAARALFSENGLDKVTIAEIARAAGVAGSTVYALFASKAGILRALMQATLFGPAFRAAQETLAGVEDPVRLIELTAGVSRAIYEAESAELGVLRGAAAFSADLRETEAEFEDIRRRMQKDRLDRLFAAGRARRDLTFAEAQQVMWMYTSRDIYRMLVHDGGWSPDRYQAWLGRTLLEALVERG
jgi:AcrR family transcriptional regulator